MQTIDGSHRKVLRLVERMGEPDVIECDGVTYVPQQTCTFTPNEIASRFDENDEEIETDEPADDCDAFSCSVCGYDMMFGDCGWFELEPPYKPNFKFCPNCGSKEVTDDAAETN
mgnify:CR=1 FL=1